MSLKLLDFHLTKEVWPKQKGWYLLVKKVIFGEKEYFSYETLWFDGDHLFDRRGMMVNLFLYEMWTELADIGPRLPFQC